MLRHETKNREDGLKKKRKKKKVIARVRYIYHEEIVKNRRRDKRKGVKIERKPSVKITYGK